MEPTRTITHDKLDAIPAIVERLRQGDWRALLATQNQPLTAGLRAPAFA